MLKSHTRQNSLTAILAATALLAVASTGCEMDGKEFRAVAGPSLELGLTTVVTGIIEGAFAEYTPDDIDNNSGVTDDSGAGTSS